MKDEGGSCGNRAIGTVVDGSAGISRSSGGTIVQSLLLMVRGQPRENAIWLVLLAEAVGL